MSESLQQANSTESVSIARASLVIFILLTVVTGVIYPWLVTLTAQTFFPNQSNGGIIMKDDKAIGAELIGQSFSDDGHFWGRLSATTPMPYNASASSGSNLGPTNPALLEMVKTRVEALRTADPTHQQDLIPVDLVTASASGLDPHISLAAANFQINRVAKAHQVDPYMIQKLVNANTEFPLLGFLGEKRVNVLKINLALDAL
jgi:K+-transporting ATPase ATPase C chain